jgi:ferredoxin
LLGLVLPTHAFTAPWAAIRFAWWLPRGGGRDAFVLTTRGGTKLGRHFLPGMEGTAGYLCAGILVGKGYRVKGVLGLDMPTSWTALHPGLGAQSVRTIVDRAKPKATRFMAGILAGQRELNGLLSLVLGLLLAPVSFGYLLLGRLFLAKLFYAAWNCDGCGLCATGCPLGAIEMRAGEGGTRPYWTFKCESCMRCMNLCPRQAIEVNYPYAVGLYYLASVPVAARLLRRLGLSAAPFGLTWLLQKVYVLGVGYTAYHLLSVCLRKVPLLNRLLTHSTPTHYYRRYHGPGVDMAALAGAGERVIDHEA